MEPYASVEDYVARYGEVDDPKLLQELLMDATRLIACELERAGLPVGDETAADKRMQVCRAVAYRGMDQEAQASVPFGATQFSRGAGGYTESFSISNPYRDVYLTKAEKRLLGIGRSRIRFIMPGGVKDEG